MAATYPGAVRIFDSRVDLVDVVMAEHVNILQDEVTAVEASLGTGILASSWSGSYTNPPTYASLTVRLTNIEAGLTGLTSGKQDAASALTITGVQSPTNKTIDGSLNTLSNIPQSAVTSLGTDLGLKAPLASPTLTGTPAAPTAAPGTNTTQVATTAFVTAAVAAVAVADGSITTLKLADDAVTYAKMQNVTAQYRTLGRITAGAGSPEELTPNDLSTVIQQADSTTYRTGTGAVVLATSPALLGNPTAPTQTPGTNSTRIASTEFVATAIAAGGAGMPYHPFLLMGA